MRAQFDANPPLIASRDIVCEKKQKKKLLLINAHESTLADGTYNQPRMGTHVRFMRASETKRKKKKNLKIAPNYERAA